MKANKKKQSLLSAILTLPSFKISPPEKCPVLQSLSFIFSFSSSFFLSSILFKYLFSSICLSSFHLFQFFSNFFKYLSSNFLSSHPYNNFIIYFPGNSPHLKSLSSTISIFFCFLTSTFIRPSNSSNVSPAFSRFSLFSYVSFSAVNSFNCTRYLSTPFIFFLFRIFSISYSSVPSTSMGFPSSFLCPFICSLYQTIQLTLTTG